MSKSRRKKAYRKITDMRFKEFRYMPLKQSKAEVREWMTNNEMIMSYIASRCEKLIIFTDGYWQGINYQKTKRTLVSEQCRHGSTTKFYQVCEQDGIDLMPPIAGNDWEYLKESINVIAWLATKEKLLNYFIILAVISGYIENLNKALQGVYYDFINQNKQKEKEQYE